MKARIPTDIEIEESCPHEGIPRCPRCQRLRVGESQCFTKMIPFGDGTMTVWDYTVCRNCGYEIPVEDI